MSVDLFSRVRGAASLHRIGQDFWTKDVAAMNINLKAFGIPSNAFGDLARRGAGRLIEVTFTPVGVWTLPQLAILFPYLNPRYGDYNTPIRNVTAVTNAADTITVHAHGFLTGTGVRMGGSKTSAFTMPTGLAVNTTYYVISVDANTIKLATTEANALTGTQIDITSDGSGQLFLIQNSPLIITTVDGVKLTLWNAAVVDQPGLSLDTLVSTMKQVKFEAYTLHGMNWSDANSLFTLETGVIGAVPPNQAQIPTVPYAIDWCTRLPVTAVDDVGNTFTVANHGLTTAEAITLDVLSAGGSLPSALTIGTTYYVIAIDANTIKVATSSGNASAGTAIPLVTAGAGTIDVVSAIQVEGIEPREAIEVTPTVTWGDVLSQSAGLACRSISKVEVKTEFVPTNMALAQITNALSVQGGTAAPGQNLPSANLDIYGPGETPFIRVYGATLEPTSLAKFGSEADRVDKLTFMMQRTFRGATQNPVAFVGTAAPTV